MLTALAAALLLAPASAALLGASVAADETTITWYLHSTYPVANVHTALDSQSEVDAEVASVSIGGLAPWMNESTPQGGSAKLAYATGFGNPEYNRNNLLAYWIGDVEGRVSGMRVTLHLTAAEEALVAVTLFRDDAIGTGGSFARASATVPAGGPHAVAFDFGEQAANVEEKLVLSVSTTHEGGVVVHHDSTDAPSSLTFTLSPFAEPPVPGPVLPAAGWAPHTMVSDNLTHRETSIVLSPTDPDLMVLCAPSGVPQTDYGSSYFHVTRDGGATWAPLQVETGSTDPRKLAFEGGDCDVAFGDDGTMYSADTWLGSLSVGHSTDGGLSWTGTSVAATAPVVDRPWLVGGPDGTLHVTWQDLQALMPSAIWYARSNDRGLTFTPAVSVTTANTEGAYTWTGNLVVSPDQQSLYSVYTRREGAAINDLDASGPETVWVAASHDGGLTWTQHLVARLTMPASYLYPSIAMDESGMLHVVYASKADVDRPIWYTSSADGGLTWTEPTKVLAGVAAWSPWVVATGAGDVAIQWYGSPDPAANIGETADWYLWTARMNDGVVTQAGPTTQTPLFTGASGMPEFNQLRVDHEGKIHLGASVYHTNPEGQTWWAIYHQREA